MYRAYCCLIVTTLIVPVTLTCVEVATDSTTSKAYCLLTLQSPPSVADAVRACAQEGYFLVSVDSQHEANFLSTRPWWMQYGVEAYWLRLMYQDGDDWLKWLDCRRPTWDNWEPTWDNNSAHPQPTTACAYVSTANGHRWRSGNCNSSVPDVIVCEKEEDNCLIHVNDHVHSRQYCYLTEPSSYSRAEQLCEGLGYSLAQFETRDEMTETFGLFAVKSVTCFSYAGYWLGLVVDDVDRWRWADGTALDWTNWRTPPTTGGATTERCGAASSSSDLWSPTDCSEQLVMLCEKSSQTLVQSRKIPQDETPILRAVPDNVAPAVTPSPTTSTETDTTTDDITTQTTTTTTQSTTYTTTLTPTTNSTPVTTHLIVNVVPADNNVITTEGISASSTSTSTATSTSTTPRAQLMAQECPMLADSPHRMVSSQQRRAGTVVKVVCSAGYVFTGGATQGFTSCHSDGQWRPLPDNCSAISCPPVPVWHGLVPNTTDRKYLTTVSVSCEPDFRFPNGRTSTVATCREGGEWVPALPLCEDTTSHSPYQLTEGTYGAIFGGVGGLLVLLWIILFLYLDVKFFKMPKIRPKKKKKRKKILEKHRNNRVVPVHTINTPLPVMPSAPPPGIPRRSSVPGSREGALTVVETIIDETQEEGGVHLVNVPHHPENATTGSSMTVLL